MSEGKRDRGCVGGWLSCFYVEGMPGGAEE